MAETKEILLCGHCGKMAVFVVRAEGTKYGASIAKSMIDYEGMTLTTWRILECALCDEPTFEQSVIEYNFETDYYLVKREAIPKIAEKKILYPGIKKRTPLPNLPMEIEKEYDDTLKVRDISIVACAVLARRTLEAIFTHENAEGNSLMQKVDYLLKSKSIPPLLADVAHLGRQIGNLGAHFDKQEVTEEDIAAMLDFLEIILQYLYVVPAKVTEVKARLTRNP